MLKRSSWPTQNTSVWKAFSRASIDSVWKALYVLETTARTIFEVSKPKFCGHIILLGNTYVVSGSTLKNPKWLVHIPWNGPYRHQIWLWTFHRKFHRPHTYIRSRWTFPPTDVTAVCSNPVMKFLFSSSLSETASYKKRVACNCFFTALCTI